jgi:hypothetical protein
MAGLEPTGAEISARISQLVSRPSERFFSASAEPGPRAPGSELGPWVPGLQRTTREERALRCARDTPAHDRDHMHF